MRRHVAVLSILALTACATPYKPMGLGGGVEEMQLSDDTYRVRARVNLEKNAAIGEVAPPHWLGEFTTEPAEFAISD